MSEPLLPGADALPPDHKSGYVAIVGRPNAGKSTLLNAFLGRKLSIVTRRPQTTRHRVLGILSDDGYQIILLDTPGLLVPRYKLQERMMEAVQRSVDEADLLLFLADATRPVDEEGLEILGDRRTLLVLTKLDLLPGEEALPVAEAYAKARDFEAIVPVSAQKNYNLDGLLREIVERMPYGPPFYPKDTISEHPERFFVTEIIREKIFEQFRQEVPYATQVNVVVFNEEEERDYIDAEIVVERDSQKGILIGKGGQALKRVGTRARLDIQEFTGRPAYLKLHVKVRDDWRNKDTFLREYGY